MHELVHELIHKAAESDRAEDARDFSQAALNVINALNAIKRPESLGAAARGL